MLREIYFLHKLFLIGFLLMFLGIIVLALISTHTALTEGKTSVSGGVLFILGFIPIGFAFGQHSEYIMLFLMLLALVIIIISIILKKTMKV